MGRLDFVIGTNIIEHNGEEIRLGHSFHEVGVIAGLLQAIRPMYFIEIGVHEGGLSWTLLNMFKRSELQYIGAEIDLGLVRPPVKELYRQKDQQLMQVDCFHPEFLAFIGSLPHKMIYCDGGNKVAELKEFSIRCYSGDTILTHDYWDGIREVEEYPPGMEVHTEVTPEDVKFMDSPFSSFKRISEDILGRSRIIGWEKK